MMTRAIVNNGFRFFDDRSQELMTLCKDDVISYERYPCYSTAISCAESRIRIFYKGCVYNTDNFSIEAYVTTFPEPLLNYEESVSRGQCIQIQKFDSVHNTNEFLKNIPKENIIKIEPLENNTYLVTYSEEMK